MFRTRFQETFGGCKMAPILAAVSHSEAILCVHRCDIYFHTYQVIHRRFLGDIRPPWWAGADGQSELPVLRAAHPLALQQDAPRGLQGEKKKSMVRRKKVQKGWNLFLSNYSVVVLTVWLCYMPMLCVFRMFQKLYSSCLVHGRLVYSCLNAPYFFFYIR